jgi:hypothetical protein
VTPDDPPPYRAIVIAEIPWTVPGAGGSPLFPTGRQRFQIAGLPATPIIVGPSTFQRPHTYNGSTDTETLARGRAWRLQSGVWVGVPLMDETATSERLASISADVNDDGFIVGAIAEPIDPWVGGRWFIRPAYWLPGSGGYTAHLLAQPSLPCLDESPVGGVTWGVGPGAQPIVAGSAFAACRADEPEAFAASLAGAPTTAPTMMPLHNGGFACTMEDPGDPVLSEALAVGVTPQDHAFAVGIERAESGQAGPGGPTCLIPAAFCDGYLQYDIRALSWEIDGSPPAPQAITVRAVAESVDFRFRAFDGAAGPAAGDEPAWSVAGGTSLPNALTVGGEEQQPPVPCRLHATAYLGYLPGTEMYGVNSNQGVAYDVHDAIVDAADPPGNPTELRTASAIGAICRAEAANEAAVYLAGGTRYPGLIAASDPPYGVLWLGRRDGEGGWEWCGRNVNDDDVAWRPNNDLGILAIHDIAPSGIAVGVATAPNILKLVLFTSLSDLNGDLKVNGADMGALLADWGPGPGGGTYLPGDLNRDDVINGADLGILLTAWNAVFAPVHMDCNAKMWRPISPIDVASTAVLLGFEGMDGLGEHCLAIAPNDAASLGEYVSTVAHILHQED